MTNDGQPIREVTVTGQGSAYLTPISGYVTSDKDNSKIGNSSDQGNSNNRPDNVNNINYTLDLGPSYGNVTNTANISSVQQNSQQSNTIVNPGGKGNGQPNGGGASMAGVGIGAATQPNGGGTNGGSWGMLFGDAGSATLMLPFWGRSLQVGQIGNNSTPIHSFSAVGKGYGLELSASYSFLMIIHGPSFSLNDFAGNSSSVDKGLFKAGSFGLSTNWSNYLEIQIGLGVGAGFSLSKTNTVINLQDNATNALLNELWFKNTQF